MQPEWENGYPNPDLLRQEADAMLAAFVEVLLDTVPKERIEALYGKGSAFKAWDSPLDYVPELSDVDLHLLLRDKGDVGTYFGSLEQALRVQQAVEERFREKVPVPLHLPRPQFLVVNEHEDFLPAPRATMRVLHGEVRRSLEDIEDDRIRAVDASMLLSHEDFLKTLPMTVIDRPGRYQQDVLRALSWRVSPTGPRILSVLGFPPKTAWSLNRTGVVEALRELGEAPLAEGYAAFYLESWQYFLSRHRDSDAARRGVLAGCRLLERSMALSRQSPVAEGLER